jgi:hypothetical protein
MDIEFHYYITYILAKKAGFKSEDAFIIAYSSQYTDDNCNQYYINSLLHEDFISKPSQTMDVTKPSVKKISIYPLFHFFPGNPDSPTTVRKDGKTNPFNTTPNSDNVRQVFEDALKSDDRYRIGVATHVFADSWAHQNFLGLEDVFNAAVIREKSFLNIGHATFLHKPDIVGNVWTDGRLVKKNEKIDNNERFMDAAEKIFYAYRRRLMPGISDADILKTWSGVRDDLKKAMGKRSLLGNLFELSRKARIKAYREIGTDIPPYDADEWRHKAVCKAKCETDWFDCYWAADNFKDSHWYRFQQAVRAHYDASLIVLKGILNPDDPLIQLYFKRINAAAMPVVQI